MTSKTLIKTVAESTGYTQKATKEFFDAAEIALKSTIATAAVGEKVKVLDTTYSVKDVAARAGRNPSTGEALSIPATKKVATKISKDFKSVVKA